jgi:hypothetical protein
VTLGCPSDLRCPVYAPPRLANFSREISKCGQLEQFPPGNRTFTLKFCFSHENFVRIVYSRTGFIRHKAVLNAHDLENLLLFSCYGTKFLRTPCILLRRYLLFEYLSMASAQPLSSETESTEQKVQQNLATTNASHDDNSDLESGPINEQHDSKNDMNQVNWENDDDSTNPLNWSPVNKWKNLGIISIMSLATYVPTPLPCFPLRLIR